MFRPEDFAELLLRLRPLLRLRAIALALRVGLALRATPAAPNRKGNIFFMARPPLLCEEGNLLSDAGFVRALISDSSSTLMPSARRGMAQTNKARFRDRALILFLILSQRFLHFINLLFHGIRVFR